MKRDSKFRQKQPINHGNLMNRIMGNNDILPEVGKGATLLMYSDRHVYEVIEVSDDYKTVKLEALDAKIDPEYLASLKGADCAGHQNWILEPTGRFSTVVWRHNAWRSKVRVVVFEESLYERAEKENIAVYKLLTPEQYKAVYNDDIRPQNVVPGITKEKFEYNKVNLIFGRKDYYYDWSF
jgi:hypothetical protein